MIPDSSVKWVPCSHWVETTPETIAKERDTPKTEEFSQKFLREYLHSDGQWYKRYSVLNMYYVLNLHHEASSNASEV